MSGSEAETVRHLIQALEGVPGWAVLKGWDPLPSLPGDLDLIVEPSHLDAIAQALDEWTRSYEGSSFWCNHIPGVPRLFAYLPAAGFGGRLLEIDLVSHIPLRGWPCVTYERLQRFLEWDQRGFVRTTRAASDTLKFLYKGASNVELESTTDQRREVLVDLLGPRTAALMLSRRLTRISNVLAQIIVTLRATRDPRFVMQRIRFRTRMYVGDQCEFDASLGRAARQISGPQDLRDRVTKNHRLIRIGSAT